jgi:multidrug resistance protein, MATE family
MTATTILLSPISPAKGALDLRRHLQVLRWWKEVGKLLQAASPIVLIGILNMAMSIADVVMLGRHDPQGLATVVVVSDLYSIVFNFSAGFAGVVTPQVAAALGARVRWQICSIVRRTLVLVLLLGAAGGLLILGSPRLLEAFGMRQFASAYAYAAFMAGTYVFMLLFALARAVLSAMGRPAAALLAICAALPVKIAANYALIFGAWGAPALGVAGAGLASLIVAALMGGSLLLYLFRSRTFAEFDAVVPGDPVALPAFRSLATSGLLLGLTAVAETGVFLASTILVGLFAAHDLIVHTLVFRAVAAFYLVIAAVGQAVTIRMAYLHARSAITLQVHASRAATSCSLALIALILSVLVLGADPLGSLLAQTIATDADLSAPTTGLLRIAGLTLAALVPSHMIAAVLRARHDVGVPTGLVLVCYWGLALSVMLVLCNLGFGARGAWYSLLLGALASSACFSIYYFTRSNRTSLAVAN